jgi:glycosyltransferase involved in cell wall biosynthesis
MKVLFLLSNGSGIGGTIQTTFNLAAALAARGHEVEVLSCFRRRDVPSMRVPAGVRMVSLLEARTTHPDYERDHPLRGKPARFYPREDFHGRDYDLLVEQRAASYLRESDADVVIGTRPGLNVWLSRLAPERMIRIGQEHLTRRSHHRQLRKAIARSYPRLDAFVTVSARDAADYREHLSLPDTRLLFIPNSVPAPRVPPSDGRQKIIVAAGRLVIMKRYDILIRAFAKVAADYPDWQLRIYGAGDKDAELRRLVTELRLHNNVLMMGGFSPLEPEWAKGAIAAVPSDREPFGMTLVEAMRCGLPVVSTDAPYGPREILADGEDGRLTPVGDPDALADGLLELIGYPELRSRMAAAALHNSARYDPSAIADQYEELFAQLVADKARRAPRLSDRLRRWSDRLASPFGGAEVAGRGAPTPVLGTVGVATSVTADCLVTADGGVELRFPNGAPPAGSTLLWRRAEAGQPETEIVVPVPAAGADGSVVIERAGADVSTGRWELMVLDPDGDRAPVSAGFRDTRALLSGAGVAADGSVHVQLPYATGRSALGLRVWRAATHAEVGDVHFAADAFTVTGRLIGATFGAAPELELRCRATPELVERLAVQPVGVDRWRAVVPAAALTGHRVSEQDLWDGWLRVDADAAPIRLARLLDDVFNKQLAYIYPEVVLAGTPRDARVQPYFTAHNGFSVRVVDPPA